MDDIIAGLALFTLILAAVPALLSAVNLFAYRTPRAPSSNPGEPLPGASVILPARNEEACLPDALDAILASEGVDLEVLILDDQSTDRTVEIATDVAERDPRVRLLRAGPLPHGWCGKPRACHEAANHATRPYFVFVDADVRVTPDAVARLVTHLRTTGAHLASGVPHQTTGSFLERLLIPLIHFVLLGFLPIPWMRRTRSPAFAAGCGQMIVARADTYHAVGGHAAVRQTLHDGLELTRRFREAGYATDLCDLSRLARCRMYRGSRETWEGLAKNATEGLGHPRRIAWFTMVLLGGQVVPWLLAPWSAVAAVAAGLGLATRAVLTARFRQSVLGTILHPVSIVLLLAIQWQALARQIRGRPRTWRGRSYAR